LSAPTVVTVVLLSDPYGKPTDSIKNRERVTKFSAKLGQLVQMLGQRNNCVKDVLTCASAHESKDRAHFPISPDMWRREKEGA